MEVKFIDKTFDHRNQNPRAILRSSRSSLPVLSILVLENSLMEIPSTTFHLPPWVIWQGNEYMIPAGTPYEFPSLMTPILVYFPGVVPNQRSWTWSQAAAAALAAEDFPMTEMISAPLFWTLVRKGPSSQASSLTTSRSDLPPTVALKVSGYWVAEWLPQMNKFLI